MTILYTAKGRASVDVLTSVRKHITEQFLGRAGLDHVGDDDPLLDSGIIDSMSILQLVGFLESEFNIEVDDDEILPEHFETMASITAFVSKKLDSSGG